jgi:hypothetical protein
MAKFEDYTQLADELIASAASSRTQVHTAMEKMFFMQSSDAGSMKGGWIKETIAPDLHSAIKGAQRMMTATEPRFKVPEYQSDATRTTQVNTVVDWANRTWRNAGVVRGGPLQIDATLSALLYGEVNIATQRSRSLVDMAITPAEKARATGIARRTSLLPEILNPRICYPLVTSLGLEAHLVSRQMRIADAIRRGGRVAEQQLGDRNKFEFVTYREIWDLEYHVVWIDGQGEPLVFAPHKLSVLPVVYRRIEGSQLWDQYDSNVDSIQPFLYSAWKSGLWERYNLALTTFYSLLFAMGAGGVYKFKSNGAPDRVLEMDFSHPGALITLLPGEDISPLGSNVLTPEMIEAIKIAEQKLVEATIYKQTLGEPLGANAPFSMVSLLSQAGRQPLIPYQRMVSHAIGECMQNGQTILREAKEKVEWQTSDGAVVYDPSQVDEEMELSAELEIDLPQDAKQNVQIALSAVSGGILDLETALRDIMKQDQPEKIIKAMFGDQMVKTIFGGEMAKLQAKYQMEIQSEQAAMQQAMMAQQQAAQQQQAGPPQGPQQGPPQGPPQPGPQRPGQPGPQDQAALMAMMQQQGGPQGMPGPGGQQMDPAMMEQLMSNQAQEGLPMTDPMQDPGMMGGPNANPRRR